jgi:hypothetical protein
LDRAFDKIEDELRSLPVGAYTTVQNDGWSNLRKHKLQAMLFLMNGKVCQFNDYSVQFLVSNREQTYLSSVHDVLAECKTADNLLKLMIREKKKIEDELKLRLVGWVSDAGSDLKKAQKMLQQMFPHLIVLDCWAHQVGVYLLA